MSHFKEPVYPILGDTRLEAGLTKGQTVSRSYASDVVVNDMGADGSYSTQAITDTAETLTINKEKEASIYIKKLDELQAHLSVKQKYGRKLANAMINQIDGDVTLAAYNGAGTTMDDGTFSGTSGNAFTVTASNVATVFTTAKQKLRLKNVIYNNRFQSSMDLEVPEGMPIAIVSPEILTYIELFLGGKDTLLGDQVSRNGFQGYFMGFNVFCVNTLPWTGVLSMVTQPSDGDTVTVNGVTFTFKTTLGSTAGNVLIGGSADAARANLAGLINTPGTTDSNGVALTAANQRLMKNLTATNSNSADTLTLVGSGWGTVVVSKSFTDPTDTWTSTKQMLHCLFALSKSVSVVIQKDPSLEDNSVSGKIGRDYITWAAYGIKVFVDQAPQIVALEVNSSSFTAAATTQK
ncbi:hypothetical protein IVB45_02240 [Bradyrhizobium sp. 4]|uniref:hypothetical protein n=1 Tax=Bradyrhizobium sp. 4 TaxID=2782678 RepID=UPI001FFE80D9|nr:hypothetical protein [Bradyrhizobium sp. 4]UPJ35854.1 hypothetical protein IVB45_02240 [Bradyrhizobium sp. 4]